MEGYSQLDITALLLLYLGIDSIFLFLTCQNFSLCNLQAVLQVIAALMILVTCFCYYC